MNKNYVQENSAMKVLYYDCFCGISGDMNLGALIDLGVDKNYLINEILKLNLDSEYEIKIEKALKSGISGTKVDVILKNHHVHEHHHRNLDDIKNIINNSSLNDSIKKLSMDIFTKVAEAEALVHNKPLNEVHFHEVGAIDSIIDIVGAAICLDYLKVDKILASSVQVGGGFVKCAHGIIPVPAPATVEILRNIPIKSGIVQFETTTPTGAAILAANVEEFIDKVDFSVEKVGYGIGHRDLEIPNVLRVYLSKEEK
jgi:pyridinium-3,5-bisthiocarboxylic acid mononucleotide nickel chelatase